MLLFSVFLFSLFFLKEYRIIGDESKGSFFFLSIPPPQVVGLLSFRGREENSERELVVDFPVYFSSSLQVAKLQFRFLSKVLSTSSHPTQKWLFRKISLFEYGTLDMAQSSFFRPLSHPRHHQRLIPTFFGALKGEA